MDTNIGTEIELSDGLGTYLTVWATHGSTERVLRGESLPGQVQSSSTDNVLQPSTAGSVLSSSTDNAPDKGRLVLNHTTDNAPDIGHLVRPYIPLLIIPQT